MTTTTRTIVLRQKSGGRDAVTWPLRLSEAVSKLFVAGMEVFRAADTVRPNPQVELTAKQPCWCFVPVMLRVPAVGHLHVAAVE